jgi:transcriptional regulator with XRE-family HTH domain
MSEPAFGEIIRRGREKARISQARLAELIGRSPSTIRSWEHGRTRPSDRSYLKALAAVLGLGEKELVEAAGLR